MTENSMNCLFKRFCNLKNLTSFNVGTGSQDADLYGNTNFFRILFPMMLVVGVFIIIALIVFMQK